MVSDGKHTVRSLKHDKNSVDRDVRSFGHAAAKAYAAYKDPVFLQYAIESWWVGRRRTISQSDLSAGKIAGKNFTLAKVCEGRELWILHEVLLAEALY
jgi:hypothetical protein